MPSHRAVNLDFRPFYFLSQLFHPSLLYFLSYLTFLPQMLAEHQSGPRQDTGDKMRYKIRVSAPQKEAVSASEAATDGRGVYGTGVTCTMRWSYREIWDGDDAWRIILP